VTETTAPSREARAHQCRPLEWLGILILATLYVCTSAISAPSARRTRTATYAWIARDMMETGDWVTPPLYESPWFEKPPAVLLEAALCFPLWRQAKPPRVVAHAIFFLFATLALAVYARLYGAETARWLLLLSAPPVGNDWLLSRRCPRTFLSARCSRLPWSVRRSFWGLTSQKHSDTPSNTRLALILFVCFLGLALLAKGPAAIFSPVGAVFSGRSSPHSGASFPALSPAAIASFCLTALPWYILCARRNPDFFASSSSNTISSATFPQFQHSRRFGFTSLFLLVASCPWTAAMLLTVYIERKRADCESKKSASILCSCCLGLCSLVCFFRISQSSLPGYTALYSAICLIVTRASVTMSLHPKSFRFIHHHCGHLSVLLFPSLEWSHPHIVLGTLSSGLAA